MHGKNESCSTTKGISIVIYTFIEAAFDRGTEMAIGVAGDSVTAVQAPTRNYTVPLTLMVSLYFGIGFITALNDILVPHFKDLFHLTNVTALLVQFCFFGAYFVMSLPSGWIVGKIGYKRGIVVALTVMGIGLLLFLPASIIIFYPLFLFALFVVGSGLALLQVAINPYVGALGKPETAASRLNLAGFANSFAGWQARLRRDAAVSGLPSAPTYGL